MLKKIVVWCVVGINLLDLVASASFANPPAVSVSPAKPEASKAVVAVVAKKAEVPKADATKAVIVAQAPGVVVKAPAAAVVKPAVPKLVAQQATWRQACV